MVGLNLLRDGAGTNNVPIISSSCKAWVGIIVPT